MGVEISEFICQFFVFKFVEVGIEFFSFVEFFVLRFYEWLVCIFLVFMNFVNNSVYWLGIVF